MARMEMDGAPAPDTADAFYDLGMMYSTGRDVAVDMVAAHKWFNIAATRGHKDAIVLRREVAAQMSDGEIGLAQRAARDWIGAHRELTQAPVVVLRAAA